MPVNDINLIPVCLIPYFFCYYYGFPKNAMKRRMWCEAMNISEASINIQQSATLCSMHFRYEDFYRYPQMRKRLKEDAIPCVRYF